MANSTIRVSAGVFTQETDISQVPAGLATIGGSVIGLTQKGPAFKPINVSDMNTFRNIFGNLNPNYYLPYTAQAYLKNSNSLNVVRVCSTQSPTDVGNIVSLAFPAFGTTANSSVTSSGLTALGILRARSGVALTQAALSGSSNNFILIINGSTANNLSLDIQSPNYIRKVLGTDPFAPRSGDSLTGIYVDATYDYSYFVSGPITSSSVALSVASSSPNFASAVGGFTYAQTPIIVSQNYNGMVYSLFQLYSLGDGNNENTNVKVSIDVIPSQIGVTGYPTFTVTVRNFTDTDASPQVLETFNTTMDPNSNAFIQRVIGDRQKTFNTSVSPPELVYQNDFDNKSNYIRVQVFTGYPSNARPSGFQGVPAMSYGPFFTTPYQANELNPLGNLDQREYMGFNPNVQNPSDRLQFLTTSISSSPSNITQGFLTTCSSTEYSLASALTGNLTASYQIVDVSASSSNSAVTYNKISITVPLYGGWDGIDKRKDILQAINDGTLSADFWNAVQVLGNPDEIDFNLLTIPGVFAGMPTNGAIPAKAIDLVTQRGDAFYITDMGDATILTTTGQVQNLTVQGIVQTAQGYDTNYAATYFPSLRIIDVDNNKNMWVPPSVVVMGAYAFNDQVGQPWFAPAGLNRGILNVTEARKRLTQQYRDQLYIGNVNPIATMVGIGISIWGQKTLQQRDSALNRINVRRLLIYARKTIASIAKYFVFEPNDSKTRSNLVNAVNPILERIQKLQGLNQYKIICDATNNTPDIIDRNMLAGTFILEPTKTAEIFAFNFVITRTGSALFTE